MANLDPRPHDWMHYHSTYRGYHKHHNTDFTQAQITTFTSLNDEHIYIASDSGNWYKSVGGVAVLITAGGGEANTSSNAGAGDGLALPKSGFNLPFKSLTAGSNISLTPSANEIEIAATGVGEVNTASNTGSTGLGLFKQKTVLDLEFYKINNLSSLLSFALDGTDKIDLNLDDDLSQYDNTTSQFITLADVPVDGSGVSNQITYWIDSDTLGPLDTATYPSLTELSYVKGVTSAIQTQLNGKEPTLTKGDLTETTSSVLTITGGTNAIIGSGTTIEVDQADTSNDGYLSSTDWNTFNDKPDGSGTTNELTYWVDGTTVGALAVATYPSLTELSYVKGVTSAIQTQINNITSALIDGSGTTDQITYWVDSDTIGALDTATYPSLTELSYVKGVTSSIQTQIDSKLNITDFTLAGISVQSDDATKSLYTMTSSIPVEFESSDNNTILYIDETNERVGIGLNNPAFTIDMAGRLGKNGTQLIYYPEGNFTGTLYLGDGGGSLSHSSGDQGKYNIYVGIGSGSSNTSGFYNSGIGYNTLNSLATGSGNVAIGAEALENYSGNNQIAIGYQALNSSVNNSGHLAIGYQALLNQTGYLVQNSNLAIGYQAMLTSTGGYRNLAIGYEALKSLVSTYENVAIGFRAMADAAPALGIAIGAYSQENTTGNSNVSIGAYSLRNNVTGIQNIAIGYNTLASVTAASTNIAIGNQALQLATTGDQVAIGAKALDACTTGTGNVAIGTSVLTNLVSGTNNVGIAGLVLAVGSGNVAIGQQTCNTLVNGDNNTAIGYRAMYGANNSSSNIAIGPLAMFAPAGSSGSGNTAIGGSSLFNLTSGSSNITIGNGSLYNLTSGSNNIAIGLNAGRNTGSGTNQTSSNSMYLGYQTYASADGNTNEMVFGYNVTGLGSNTVTLGNSSIVSTFLRGNVAIGMTSTPASRLDVTGLSLTGSAANSAVNVVQTWNTTGTPTAIKLNITDTASNAASNLMDLQVASTSQFKVDKAGRVIPNNVVRLKGYTVATLPATPTQGDTAFVTDLDTPAYMGVAVGGGSTVGKVFYNGTNWIT